MFYNQFLPGGTGGDIIKTYLLLKETPGKKTGALLAVLFDRLIGLIGLISITGALIALRYDWLTTTPETKQLVWGLLVVLGSAVLALVTSFVITGFKLLDKLPAHFPMRAKLIELSATYHLYAHHWPTTFAAYIAFAHHASRYVRDVSLRRIRLSRSGSDRQFFRRHADRTHDLVAADQLCRRRPARKNSAGDAARSCAACRKPSLFLSAP